MLMPMLSGKNIQEQLERRFTHIQKELCMKKQLGLEAYIYQYVPRPVQERQEFHITIEVVFASQKKGQNDPRYVQF